MGDRYGDHRAFHERCPPSENPSPEAYVAATSINFDGRAYGGLPVRIELTIKANSAFAARLMEWLEKGGVGKTPEEASTMAQKRPTLGMGIKGLPHGETPPKALPGADGVIDGEFDDG